MSQASLSLSTILLPLWLSLKLAGITTLCLLLFATPIAYWLAKPTRQVWLSHFKIFIMGIVALPLVLPPTVIGFYLLLLLSPNSMLGQWLASNHLDTLAFRFEGLVIGSLIYSLPFYIQPVYAQFLRIPKNIIEAAKLLEHNRWRRFLGIILPQAKAGIILGSLVSFAHTIGEFGVVLMIGGSISGETKVMSISIYEQVESLNYTMAHMMSALLIVIAIILVGLIASVSRYTQR